MNIKKIDKFFNPDLKNKNYFCRNCSNAFYSEIKYNFYYYFIKYLSKCLLQLTSIPNNLELYIYNNILSAFYGG